MTFAICESNARQAVQSINNSGPRHPRAAERLVQRNASAEL